jgi:threonine synthase
VAGTAGLKKAVEQGLIPPGAAVVSVGPGNGLKDTASAQKAAGVSATAAESPLIRIPPDMDMLVDEFKKRGIRA